MHSHFYTYIRTPFCFWGVLSRPAPSLTENKSWLRAAISGRDQEASHHHKENCFKTKKILCTAHYRIKVIEYKARLWLIRFLFIRFSRQRGFFGGPSYFGTNLGITRFLDKFSVSMNILKNHCIIHNVDLS